MNRNLRVLIGDVATANLWEGDRGTLLQLDEAYLDLPRRPVLGQWFEDRLTLKARQSKGLHAWFENALPERGGAVRKRVVRALGLDDDDDLALLAALGEQLPGNVYALETRASPHAHHVATVEEPAIPSGLRASLGGMQLKFSVSGAPDRLTLGIRDDARQSWILKVSGPAYPDLAENEAAVMRWCRGAGFDVPDVEVVPRAAFPPIDGLPTTSTGFLVRRYDRVDGGRVHQEDFAQVLGLRSTHKYDGADTVRVARAAYAILGVEGLRELLKRLVVVIATGNGDAHLKNWSLLYPNGIRASWSPLYDQVSTILYPDLHTALALRMGNARYFKEVGPQHLEWIREKVLAEAPDADRFTSKDLNRAIDGVIERFRAAFTPEPMGMSRGHAARLIAHWAEVPLLARHGLERPRV